MHVEVIVTDSGHEFRIDIDEDRDSQVVVLTVNVFTDGNDDFKQAAQYTLDPDGKLVAYDT